MVKKLSEGLTETERILFHRGLMKNTGVFFVVFAALLLALGFFVYQQVSTNLFDDVDRQLTGAIQLAGHEARITQSKTGNDLAPSETNLSGEPTVLPESTSSNDENESLEVSEGLSGAVMSSAIESAGLNPQLTFVIRNSKGESATSIALDNNSPTYLQDLPFQTASLEKPILQQFDGHWLRSSSIPLTEADQARGYLQVVSNVDSEMYILSNFTTTMAGAFCVALLVAAGLSYALSRRAMKPAAAAWRQQAAFVQDASHELRTPLTVIKTVQEQLLSHPRDRIVDHFEEISTTVEEADRLAQLSQSLLAVTSLDAGASTLNKTTINLGELVQTACAPYAEYAELQEKTFKVETADNCFVSADEKSLKQLLAIVLDNALKYTAAHDKISVNVTLHSRTVELTVHNSGTHLTKEEAERAFERFYRSDTARAFTSGSGLGLALAQRITEAHQGAICLIPDDKGVCAKVSLPLHKKHPFLNCL